MPGLLLRSHGGLGAGCGARHRSTPPARARRRAVVTTGRVQSEACAREVADVVVIGSGPAGLAAATAIRRSHPGRVLVVERQARAGGIPAQCDHRGFGLRDLHRSYSGPDYSRALAGQALEAGVEIITETTAFIESDGALAITGPAGLRHVEAAHVLLATGRGSAPAPHGWCRGRARRACSRPVSSSSSSAGRSPSVLAPWWSGPSTSRSPQCSLCERRELPSGRW